MSLVLVEIYEEVQWSTKYIAIDKQQRIVKGTDFCLSYPVISQSAVVLSMKH